MLRRWNKKLEKAVRKDPEVEPPLKQFNLKDGNLVILVSLSGETELK